MGVIDQVDYIYLPGGERAMTLRIVLYLYEALGNPEVQQGPITDYLYIEENLFSSSVFCPSMSQSNSRNHAGQIS